MAGSLGILGVLLDVSLKVLPRPPESRTLGFDCERGEALERLQGWCAASPAPAASAWLNDRLYVRYEGSTATLNAMARRIGGEATYEAERSVERACAIRRTCSSGRRAASLASARPRGGGAR